MRRGLVAGGSRDCRRLLTCHSEERSDKESWHDRDSTQREGTGNSPVCNATRLPAAGTLFSF